MKPGVESGGEGVEGKKPTPLVNEGKRENPATLRATPPPPFTARRPSFLVSCCLFSFPILLFAAGAGADDMARFPSGSVAFPFRGEKGEQGENSEKSGKSDNAPVTMKTPAFRIDKRAVGTSEFLAFVRAHPRYARSRIPRLVADDSYLRSWKSDFDPGGPPAAADVPVTTVSWHAAKAYCAAQNKRLPTTAEWERVAATAASKADASTHERIILAWYARSTADVTPAFGAGTTHAQGVRDLHGVIWEWTSDYNAWTTAGVNTRGRTDEPDDGLFCGGGASRMNPGTPYATYMRWAFRASLKPDYTVAALGFRCARDD